MEGGNLCISASNQHWTGVLGYRFILWGLLCGGYGLCLYSLGQASCGLEAGMIIGLVLVGYVVMGLISVLMHVTFYNDGIELQPLLFFFLWFLAIPFEVVEGFIMLDRFLARKLKERKRLGSSWIVIILEH
jgi:hypothetical protein